MRENEMLVFYEKIVEGEPKLEYYSTHSTTAPFSVKVPGRPGIGNKYWAFNTWPDGKTPDDIMLWSFQDAPTANTSTNANIAAIAAITKTPDDVFTWWPEEETPPEE